MFLQGIASRSYDTLFIDRAVPPEERGRGGYAVAAAAAGRRNLRDLQRSRQGEEGGDHGDPPSAYPAREVVSVKVAGWWSAGR